MQNLKQLWNYMKGSRLIYVGSVGVIGLATLFSLISPLVIRFAIDSVIGEKPVDMPGWAADLINLAGGTIAFKENLWMIGVILFILTALNGICFFLKGKWSAVASEETARNIRNRLFKHLQVLSYDYHVKAATGDLIQRCTSDVETIRRFLAVQFVEIGRAIFMMVFVSVVMFSLNTKLALVSMIIVPIVISFSMVFFIKVKSAFKESDEAEGRLSTVLQENLTGVRVVRAFGRQSHEVDKFDEKNSEYRNLNYRLIQLMAMYWSVSDLMCLLQIGVILVLGSYWASLGQLTLGTLVVFTTYEGMLLWPVRQMGRILTDMGKTFVSSARIEEILNTPAELSEDNLQKPSIGGEISFENVSFNYGEKNEVLKNITFNVKKGQTVSILGPTGSGKTSLVNLLLRLYDYNEGSIIVDGIDLKNIDKQWIRRNIGMVTQETFLFSKTIKENIAFAREKAYDEEIFNAAEIASVHNVITEFDRGYETPVGERGVTLSGGQKQRVSIARTVINDYPVLIFDDSLSAVDAETDAQIRKALRERSKNVTTFIISHRVSTLSEADLILVLDKGELVQKGTHEQLIQEEGFYHKVWSIQNQLEQDLQQELVG